MNIEIAPSDTAHGEPDAAERNVNADKIVDATPITGAHGESDAAERGVNADEMIGNVSDNGGEAPKKRRMSTRAVTRAAVIGALYLFVSLLTQPFASGLVQCRIGEALTVLPALTGAAVPGLFIGCLLFNLLSGAIATDVIVGSLATLLAALATWQLGKRNAPAWLLALPSVVLNGLLVGAVLVFAYGLPVPYPLAALYVALGQAVACYALGLPLLYLARRFRHVLLL